MLIHAASYMFTSLKNSLIYSHKKAHHGQGNFQKFHKWKRFLFQAWNVQKLSRFVFSLGEEVVDRETEEPHLTLSFLCKTNILELQKRAGANRKLSENHL